MVGCIGVSVGKQWSAYIITAEMYWSWSAGLAHSMSMWIAIGTVRFLQVAERQFIEVGALPPNIAMELVLDGTETF